MKQLHFTGRSYWYKDILYTIIYADFGYSLIFKNGGFSDKKAVFLSKSYEEQREKLLNDFVSLRDYRQGGDTEVYLMSEKKLNNWLSKHKYDKIEL
ncbi:unknown [Lactococcus phage Q54]|uniref:Uncharacterized protein n=1 Tax=Lactococcus phage Q54 TaxID=382685 RepID=Q0GXT0_9CAUD|nr:hypothetical protein Q54_gp42 [Lactococcus phage Q54]ABF22596.1 unknown [Lactococcus phage Q54]